MFLGVPPAPCEMLQQYVVRPTLAVALILNKCLLNIVNGFKMFLGILISPSDWLGEGSLSPWGAAILMLPSRRPIWMMQIRLEKVG